MTPLETVIYDLLRTVALVQAAFVSAATLDIVRRYLPVLKTATDRNQRLLAYHIVLIGLSYTGGNVSICIDLMARYGQGWSWRLPLCLFIFSVGDLALCLMIWRLILTRRLLALTKQANSTPACESGE